MKAHSISKRLTGMLLFMLLATGIMPAAAQEFRAFQPYQRLFMLGVNPSRDGWFQTTGDIYSWQPGETSLFRETYHGYNKQPVISPDGTKAVYLSITDDYVAAVQASDFENIGYGPDATNIWLMDLTTRPGDSARFVRIADQVSGRPADADDYLPRRSTPVWSPDSTRVAWLELDYIRTKFSGRIMIYDTRTGTTGVAARGVGLGYADGGEWGIPDLAGWGSAIASETTNVYNLEDTAEFGNTLSLFGENGRVADILLTYFEPEQETPNFLQWVLYRDVWHVALHYPAKGWVALNTTGNTFEQLANPPFIQAISGSGWTGHLGADEPRQITWEANTPVVDAIPAELPLTFTPAGVPVWRSMDEVSQLITFDPDGKLQPVLPFVVEDVSMTAAAWMPLQWRADGQGTPVEIPPEPCCR